MTDEMKQAFDEFTRQGIRHTVETNDCNTSNTIVKEKEGTTKADAIIYALKMVESNNRQIAAMTGFSNPKYMSKVFKQEEGMLPNEYRRINA